MHLRPHRCPQIMRAIDTVILKTLAAAEGAVVAKISQFLGASCVFGYGVTILLFITRVGG